MSAPTVGRYGVRWIGLFLRTSTRLGIYRVVFLYWKEIQIDGRSADRYNGGEERRDNMTMQSILREKNMTMYRLSQISGVPKTTVIDICSGKSDIEGCTAKTVMQLSRALGCTMEELMQIDNARYDRSTGLPKDESYLEKGLPSYLQKSVAAMQASWGIVDGGGKDQHWDLYWGELNADINSAETEQEISSDQAWYLRRKYLRMEKDDHE